MPMACYVFLIVCPSTIIILCNVIKLSTTNDIRYINTINTLPYRITTKHVSTLIVNCPNTKNESL